MDYKTPQVIISSYPIDETYKLEEVLFNSWKRLEKIISKTSDTNVNQVLSQLCVKSKTDHETVQLGLLYRLLTDVEAGPTCYRDISTTCRDNFQSVFKALCSLVSEKFFKMAPVALQQLFWFTNESLKNSLNGIDGLVYNMLRSLTTPEINKQMPLHHLQLVQSVVEAISHNIKYFTNHQHLIRDTVTIMLTLIPHHHHHQNLLNQEINICVYFLTTKFEECSLIGKDLIRLLVNVANINGLNKVWHKLITTNPQSTGISTPLSILSRPTSKHLAMTCLSQKLDTYLTFTLNQIAKSLSEGRDSSYNYYLKWMDEIIFSVVGETSIIKPNIARLLIINHNCGEHSAEKYDEQIWIEAKSIVIEWILSISANNMLENSNLKLAIFYEFIVFALQPDSKSQQTPSTAEITLTWKILGCLHKRNPALVNQIASFIPTLVSQFVPSLKEYFQNSITASVSYCYENVFPLMPFEYLNKAKETPKPPSISPQSNDDKNTGKEKAGQVKPTVPAKQEQKQPAQSGDVRQKIKVEETAPIEPTPAKLSKPTTNNPKSDQTAPEPQVQVSQSITTKVPDKKPSEASVKIESLSDIDEPLQKTIRQAQRNMSNWLEACNSINFIIDQLVDVPYTTSDLNKIIEIIAETLSESISRSLKLLVKNYNKETYNTIDGELDLSLFFMCPVFVLMKHMKIPGSKYSMIWTLVDHMRVHEPLISFFILFFDLFEPSLQTNNLKTRKAKNKISQEMQEIELEDSMYLKYSMKWLNKTIEDALFDDLEQCSLVSHELFSHTLFKVYRLFGSKMIEESRFIHLIVGTLDSDQLKNLLVHIISGEISLIPNDDIVDVIDDSLQWESFEQVYFWQVLLAHTKLSLNQVWQIIPELDWKNHAEAINAVVPLLKLTQPKVDIMKCLFARQSYGQEDQLIILILTLWESRFEASVLTTLQSYLTLLKENSRVEIRNISLAIEQLSCLHANGHCKYLFTSKNVLSSIQALKDLIPSMTKSQKMFINYVDSEISK